MMAEGDIIVIWKELKRKETGYNITLFDTEEEAEFYVLTLKSMKQPYEATVCRVINWNGKGKLGDILESHGRG